MLRLLPAPQVLHLGAAPQVLHLEPAPLVLHLGAAPQVLRLRPFFTQRVKCTQRRTQTLPSLIIRPASSMPVRVRRRR